MSKQPIHTQTAETTSLPQSKRRGRPTIGEKTMTAAERKARSRKMAFDRGLQSLNESVMVQLSCPVDIATRSKLVAYAKEHGKTVGQVIESLVASL